MDVKEIKESLRGALPRGTAKLIQGKLADAGKDVSLSWVSRVTNPDSQHWDDDIINEALIIAKERRDKLEKLALKVSA